MENSTVQAAAIQMCSGENKQQNLQTATELVIQAARNGAQLVVLPELFNFLGRYQAVAQHSETAEGETLQIMSNLASRLQITLVAGSLALSTNSLDRPTNSCFTFGPDGKVLGTYDKIHLFDIDLPETVTVTESQEFKPGTLNQPSSIASEVGRLGTAICYDLRFPELFRTPGASEVKIWVIPAAFTMTTGRAHWEILLRARAIENQAFIIAANQSGTHSDQLTTYGHSMIIDPWGTILSTLQHEPQGVIHAQLDLKKQDEIRTRLPVLKHRML